MPQTPRFWPANMLALANKYSCQDGEIFNEADLRYNFAFHIKILSQIVKFRYKTTESKLAKAIYTKGLMKIEDSKEIAKRKMKKDR